MRRCRAHGALQTAAIIPLGPDSHRDSSSLPEGCLCDPRRRSGHGVPCRSTLCFAEGARSLARICSASRAGSPLLFGLAPRGVFRALAIASEAVGSYPTFSPLPNDASSERRLAGFPARCHRAALRRRFNFLWHYPWLRLAEKPPGVTRRVALSRVLASLWPAMPQDGVRTFLPLLRLATQQPAITRPARWIKYNARVPETSL